MIKRGIKKIVNGMQTQDGAGVKLVRVISKPDIELFDPFLLLDAFDSKDPSDYIPGFPWHPHRGIETVTYLIKGEIEHGDSIGNKGTINDGCCQWMTAGSGIKHQEMPKPSPEMLGVQLWLNLPSKDKMAPPQYRDIRETDIPIVEKDGARVRIISGTYEGTLGPTLPDYVQMTFLDIDLEPDTSFELSLPSHDNAFIYTLLGHGDVISESSSESLSKKDAALLEEGEGIHLKSGEAGMRFFLFSGKPLKESIAWGGPIVMNTKEELAQAFSDLENGTFIR